MSDDLGGHGALLYFWPRYRDDTRDGSVLRLNQNSAAFAGARPGDTVWAFAPLAPGRYAVIARLHVLRAGENPPGSAAREDAGRWFIRADPAATLYFNPNAQPDAADLIRSLGLRADAAILGQSFQGGSGVRRLSPEQAQRIAAASRDFPLDGRLTPPEAVPKVRIGGLQHRQSVLRTMARHEELGGTSEFLRYYGYSQPDAYWIEHDGKRYPSKALLGVAWRYDAAGQYALLPSQFSGGKDTVQPTAERLGFRVVVMDDARAGAASRAGAGSARAKDDRPAFWWVNNKQTNRQEVAGGYLWSPKANKNGARNATYDNMRRVLPGDVVFAYAGQRIAHVGVATCPALPAPKPLEFGGAGANWADEGWMVPVHWRPVSSPIRPRDLIAELRPHLPERHSPLRAETGEGNQNVYLAAITGGLAAVLLPRLGLDLQALRHTAIEVGGDTGAVERADEALAASLTKDLGLDATVREALVAARRGQGRFRLSVLAIERSCRLTGVADPRLLRASHIRPWRSCETHAQRLDGENGLMLTPTTDHLFDQGYISFGDDGTLLVSPQINRADLERVGVPIDGSHNVGSFTGGQQAYLAYHRSNVFLDGESG